jgi:hypothetical protein
MLFLQIKLSQAAALGRGASIHMSSNHLLA